VSVRSARRTLIGVAIVAETRLYRDGLAHVLECDPRFRVVGTAGDLAGAVDLVSSCRDELEVVLLDQGIPEGASAIRALHEVTSDIRVVAVAVREVHEDVLPWVEAGVVGLVPHDVSLDELLSTLALVTEGCGLCSPRITAVLLAHVASMASRRRSTTIVAPGLTERERQIALLINQGLSNKEIGVRLGITVPTVKNHVHSILEKLHVRRRGEAAVAVRGEEQRALEDVGF
jgi:DNA-binding NarL/FixJ family response regulator